MIDYFDKTDDECVYDPTVVLTEVDGSSLEPGLASLVKIVCNKISIDQSFFIDGNYGKILRLKATVESRLAIAKNFVIKEAIPIDGSSVRIAKRH